MANEKPEAQPAVATQPHKPAKIEEGLVPASTDKAYVKPQDRKQQGK